MRKKIFLPIITLLVATFILGACKFDYDAPDKGGDDTTEGNDKPADIVVPSNKEFVHLGMFHTEADFERVVEKVYAGAEPWATGYKLLSENSHSSTTYFPNPVVNLIRGGNSAEQPLPDNYSVAMNDAAAAYQNGLMYNILLRMRTPEDTVQAELHAAAAVNILNSWANTCTEITGNSNVSLAAGIYGHQFANAAELVRDFEGWDEAEFETFKTWLKNVFLSLSMDFLDRHHGTCGTHYWANWDLANILNVMSVGVLCDDVETYSYAIDYLMNGVGNGQLIKTINYFHAPASNDDIALGQCQESGRDQGHAMLCIGLLGNIATIAGNQGEDVWGYNDNAILKGAEYAAKFNFAQLDVPFTAYTRLYDKDCKEDVMTEVADDEGRGGKRPIWELLYAHYTSTEGIAARYLKMARFANYPEGGGGDYGPNSGGYDALGFGTLMYAIDEGIPTAN